jgi:hypothetical protein
VHVPLWSAFEDYKKYQLCDVHSLIGSQTMSDNMLSDLTSVCRGIDITWISVHWHMNIALLAKGGNVSDIHLPQDSRLQALGLTPSGTCGKHVTHCWHDLMICQACSLVRWNCLCKAEAFDGTKHDIVRQLLQVLQFVLASPKQAQRLGYLPRHYYQQVGWGD